jgi:hypothetical protein
MIMSVYVLFIALLTQDAEQELKSYPKFEDCWAAATAIVKNRNDIVARCVLRETE